MEKETLKTYKVFIDSVFFTEFPDKILAVDLVLHLARVSNKCTIKVVCDSDVVFQI